MKWEHFLANRGADLNKLGIQLKGMNTVRFHSDEKLEHRFVKFLIAHHLFEKGHYFKTEQPLNQSRCDVIDLENLVIYEVETLPTEQIRKKKLDDFYHPLIEDILIVDLRKLNFDWRTLHEMASTVKRYCSLT